MIGAIFDVDGVLVDSTRPQTSTIISGAACPGGVSRQCRVNGTKKRCDERAGKGGHGRAGGAS
jgi:beta-phosphoglucomutase-like phosphatase (HAD superfamily)